MILSCSSGLGSRWSIGSSSPDPHSESSSGVNVTLLAILMDASGRAVTSPIASFDVHFRSCSTTDGWKLVAFQRVNKASIGTIYISKRIELMLLQFIEVQIGSIHSISIFQLTKQINKSSLIFCYFLMFVCGDLSNRCQCKLLTSTIKLVG